MTALALNDLNLSADLDSQALAAVAGGSHWKYRGRSGVYSTAWKTASFKIYYNRTHRHRGYLHNVKLGKLVRRRTQTQNFYFRKDTYI